MPKRKSTAFNPTQIKDGKIVRLRKDGTIKAILDDYNPKHKKKNENKQFFFFGTNKKRRTQSEKRSNNRKRLEEQKIRVDG